MEEKNQKIEDLKKQIVEIQKIYDTDLERGKNTENDQIQANRQKKIDSLNGELKVVETEKLEELNKRKEELDNILKKKEALNKDKSQIEEAIDEISGKTEIKDGKLEKTNEQIEYEKDLEKINSEIASLEQYETELKDISSEISSLNEKYHINENNIYNGKNTIEISDKNIYVREIPENKVDGLYCYLYQVNDKNNTPLDEYKRIYTDSPIKFDIINSDKEYAEAIQDFLSPDRIDRYLKQAEGKGVVSYVYIGDLIHTPDKKFEYSKVKYAGIEEDKIYDKLSKQEHEKLSNCIKGLKKRGYNAEYLEAKIKNIENQRPDLFGEKNKESEKQEVQPEQNNIEQPINEQGQRIEPVRNSINERVAMGDIKNAVKSAPESSLSATIGNKESLSQPINEKETSMTVYKQPNRFVTWIKEKFNKIKERFSKNKDKEELDSTGQAWQDYIDGQEENNSKKNKFIEKITQKGKLQSKEQQDKAFEAVKKWEQQNKEEIEQDEIEK